MDLTLIGMRQDTFHPLLHFGSDFVSWIFITNLKTFLEVKIDINRVNFDIIEVKLILITGWLGRTFGVPWFWWKKKISRSCFIWKCFLYQNGCFFESLLLWWVDSEPNKLMRQINVWDKISWLVQYDFKNSKRSRFDLMQNFPI